MSYIYLIGAVIISVYCAYASYKISSLENENLALRDGLNVSLRANKELEIALNESELEHKKNLEIIGNSRTKTQKERVYVEKIKYKIIKENNATCAGAINAVFGRLWEQARDSNDTKAKREK